MNILEKRIYQNIRLTNSQKEVLAKLYLNKDKPQVGKEDITQSPSARNLLAARDMLIKLGLLEETEGGHIPSEKGIEVMVNHALIDDAGELTEDGEQYAYKGREQSSEVGGDVEDQPATQGTDNQFEPYESFNILKDTTLIND